MKNIFPSEEYVSKLIHFVSDEISSEQLARVSFDVLLYWSNQNSFPWNSCVTREKLHLLVVSAKEHHDWEIRARLCRLLAILWIHSQIDIFRDIQGQDILESFLQDDQRVIRATALSTLQNMKEISPQHLDSELCMLLQDEHLETTVRWSPDSCYFSQVQFALDEFRSVQEEQDCV